ncbi:MAG: hypothetical protein ACP5OG_06130 [Candidatus Nanoarchaeia archaeon]
MKEELNTGIKNKKSFNPAIIAIGIIIILFFILAVFIFFAGTKEKNNITTDSKINVVSITEDGKILRIEIKDLLYSSNISQAKIVFESDSGKYYLNVTEIKNYYDIKAEDIGIKSFFELKNIMVEFEYKPEVPAKAQNTSENNRVNYSTSYESSSKNSQGASSQGETSKTPVVISPECKHDIDCLKISYECNNSNMCTNFDKQECANEKCIASHGQGLCTRECYNGCNNYTGLCINQSICIDTDNGMKPDFYGYTVFINNSFESKAFDTCALALSYINNTPDSFENTYSCSGNNCYVIEASCAYEQNNSQVIENTRLDKIKCLNGCLNGACINPLIECIDNADCAQEKKYYCNGTNYSYFTLGFYYCSYGKCQSRGGAKSNDVFCENGCILSTGKCLTEENFECASESDCPDSYYERYCKEDYSHYIINNYTCLGGLCKARNSSENFILCLNGCDNKTGECNENALYTYVVYGNEAKDQIDAALIASRIDNQLKIKTGLYKESDALLIDFNQSIVIYINSGKIIEITGENLSTRQLTEAVIIFNELKSISTEELYICATYKSPQIGGNPLSDYLCSTESNIEKYEFVGYKRKLYLGMGLNSIIYRIDKDKLPTTLSDNVYTDNDNDEFDYTQALDIANLSFKLLKDPNEYNSIPVLGIEIKNQENILNYSINFQENPLWQDIDYTKLNILGRNYYIIGHETNKSIRLIDLTNSIVVNDSELITAEFEKNSYYLSATINSADELILGINSLEHVLVRENSIYKLGDGAYVFIKDISYREVGESNNKAELVFFKGIITLSDKGGVIFENEIANGLSSRISSYQESIESISLQWNSENYFQVSEGKDIFIPAFESIKLSYHGMVYPAEEILTFIYDKNKSIIIENFELKESRENINILYSNEEGTSFAGIGKDSLNKLKTSSLNSLVFDADSEEYFIASFKNQNVSESYIIRAINFDEYDSLFGTNKTTIQYRKDSAWIDKKVDAKAEDLIEIGNVKFKIESIDILDKKIKINAEEFTRFDVLYSKEGLEIKLPLESEINKNPSEYLLVLREEDSQGYAGLGNEIKIKLGFKYNNPSILWVYGGGAEGIGYEIGESDSFLNYVYSPLASETRYYSSGEQDSLELVYHGGESYAKAFISSSVLGIKIKRTQETSVASLGAFKSFLNWIKNIFSWFTKV